MAAAGGTYGGGLNKSLPCCRRRRQVACPGHAYCRAGDSRAKRGTAAMEFLFAVIVWLHLHLWGSPYCLVQRSDFGGKVKYYDITIESTNTASLAAATGTTAICLGALGQ